MLKKVRITINDHVIDTVVELNEAKINYLAEAYTKSTRNTEIQTDIKNYIIDQELTDAVENLIHWEVIEVEDEMV